MILTKKWAYYNEIDPHAAQWIRNLIKAGLVAPGEVDERSIEDVLPSDVRSFVQCHWFAGIAVWSHSLRSAGWPDDRPVWTGSCPCQPFSAAGTGAGENDKRHLWPVFAKLIDACRPPAILGEQVASNLITGKRVSEHLQRLWERKARLGVLADWLEYSFAGSGASGVRVHEGQHAGGLVRLERGMRELGGEQGDRDGQCHHETPERAIQRASKATDRELEKEDGGAWIDTLQLDLEGMDYSFCCIPFPSACVGAPHIRDRLYWVADTIMQQRQDGQPGFSAEHDAGGRIEGAATRAGLCRDLWLADTTNERQHGWGTGQTSDGGDAARIEPERLCDAGRSGPVNGFWADADWLFCRDGKLRPVEPGTFPLVDGPAGGMGRSRADWRTPAGKEGFGHRAGRLKGYGNAINAEAARVFIECVMEGRA